MKEGRKEGIEDDGRLWDILMRCKTFWLVASVMAPPYLSNQWRWKSRQRHSTNVASGSTLLPKRSYRQVVLVFCGMMILSSDVLFFFFGLAIAGIDKNQSNCNLDTVFFFAQGTTIWLRSRRRRPQKPRITSDCEPRTDDNYLLNPFISFLKRAEPTR